MIHDSSCVHAPEAATSFGRYGHLIGVVIAAAMPFGLASSQTVAQFVIPSSAIAAGTSNMCNFLVRSAKAGETDSVQILVVKDRSAEKPILDQSPAELRVTIDQTIIVPALSAGRDSVTLPWQERSISGHLISLWRADANRPLCSGQTRTATRFEIEDTLVRRLVVRDSAVLDSARNIQRLKGASFVVLSLIKSIAGEIPKDEFFDLRMKFGGEVVAQRLSWRRYFTVASVDISLSTRADTTASDSLRRRITDAGLSANYALLGQTGLVASRMAYVSAIFKIFNAKSYVGAGIGGLELRGSRLEGTWLQASLLHRVYADSIARPDPSAVTSTTTTSTATTSTTIRTKAPTIFDFPPANNLFLEFYVRVPQAQFLDRLRIRGGILFPLLTRSRPEARIVLSVPVVDLDRF